VKGLLEDRYAPITEAIGFLEADFERVVETCIAWKSSIGTFSSRRLRGDLPHILESILPLTGPLLRQAWIRTSSRWTAYLDNFVLGSDTFPPISYLSNLLGCRGMTIRSREETRARGAARGLALYGVEPVDFLNLTREVRSDQDMGKWEWSATGTPQPFEELEQYSQRQIRDRLTPDMLARYSAAFGVRPFDHTFYASEAVIIENCGVKGKIRTESLDEARKWHGLTP
jgi:hypothetical protein